MAGGAAVDNTLGALLVSSEHMYSLLFRRGRLLIVSDFSFCILHVRTRGPQYVGPLVIWRFEFRTVRLFGVTTLQLYLYTLQWRSDSKWTRGLVS